MSGPPRRIALAWATHRALHADDWESYEVQKSGRDPATVGCMLAVEPTGSGSARLLRKPGGFEGGEPHDPGLDEGDLVPDRALRHPAFLSSSPAPTGAARFLTVR
jgi:hypothetical protein